MPVSLTFDNGPAPGTTEVVLDELARRGLQATFFVVGTMFTRPGGRELVARAHAEGHWIGNHSMTHATPLGRETSRAQVGEEIDGMQALLGDLAHERRFFRPFGDGGLLGPHLLNRDAVDTLRDGGYTCVLWNSVPRDWEQPTAWVDAALADVAANEHTVVVLHDLPTGAMDALPAFLDALHTDGVPVIQDFPESVLPIDRGAVRVLDGLVTT